MDQTFRLASAARGVEQEQRIFTVQRFCRTNGRHRCHRLQHTITTCSHYTALTPTPGHIIFTKGPTSSSGTSSGPTVVALVVLRETRTWRTDGQLRTAASTVALSGTERPPRTASSQVSTTLHWAAVDRKRLGKQDKGYCLLGEWLSG